MAISLRGNLINETVGLKTRVSIDQKSLVASWVKFGVQTINELATGGDFGKNSNNYCANLTGEA